MPESVSTLPGTGCTFVSALLDTLDFLSTTQAAVPPLASGLGQIADLKRRLTMILRGNTPRSRTWPGRLAVVALGLTFLPMLPALHGEPPRKEDTSKAEVEAAKARLQAAQAELRRQKAMLEDHQAALARAAAELKKAEMAANEATLQRAKLQPWEKKNTPRLRIEIVVDAEGINIPTLAKKLNEVIPQKSAVINITASGGRLMKHVGPQPLPKSAEPAAVLRGPREQEKRINDLEKKLEKVLQEMRELRKQMKESRPQSLLPKLPPNTRTPVALLPRPIRSSLIHGRSILD